MDKSRDAFRTISEVADWLGTPTHVLRFWESRFSQIKPVKRAGGRRYYRPSDMALLGGIKRLLHDDGLTIRGVQKILREQGVKHVAGLSQPLEQPEVAEEAGFAEDVEPAVETAEVVTLQPIPAKEPPEPAEATAAAAEADSPDTVEAVPEEPVEAPPIPESERTTAAEAAPDVETAGGPEPAAPKPGIFSSPGLSAAPTEPAPTEPPSEAESPAGEPVAGRDAPAAPIAPERPATPDAVAAALAEDVLATLRTGVRPDPQSLRPIYDRLTSLRARMQADRPTPPH